jgi:hypothetical protein
VARKTSTAESILDFNLDEVIDEISDFGKQFPKGMGKLGRQVKSQLAEADIDETTIPDAFDGVPKLISPGVHRWLDIAVTGYFAVLGTVCAVRGKTGAATAAFVNAGMVAGVSMCTDYEGKGNKPINFKLHGTLDAVQATTAALGPVIHGFTGEPEARFFYGQALNELAVIATTDWDEGMPSRRGSRR